jgi:hypothetical protein
MHALRRVEAWDIIFDDSILAEQKWVFIRVIVEVAKLARHLERDGVFVEVARSIEWRSFTVDIVERRL